jgi:hypothetical protein
MKKIFTTETLMLLCKFLFELQLQICTARKFSDRSFGREVWSIQTNVRCIVSCFRFASVVIRKEDKSFGFLESEVCR